MAYLLGIDLGTSYFKVGLFDETGALKGLSRLALRKESPAVGHNEVPVSIFWQLLRDGVSDALRQARIGADQVVGISYSSQANTFVLLDRADQPLTPLVLWTDLRGEPLPGELCDFTHNESYGRRSGFTGMTGHWAAAKLHWFQKNRPELWANVHRIMTISDYFTYALTGEKVGDAGTASLLGLYDLTMREWWPAALTAFDIDRSRLSQPLCPGSPCGQTSTSARDLLGLPAGVAFAVGSLDHHVAALGSGLGRIADVSISTGTVLAAITKVSVVVPQRDCYHGPDFDDIGFFRLAFDQNGAGQLDDYQQCFAPTLSVEELIGLAAAEPAGSSQESRHHGVKVRQLLEKIAAAQATLLKRVTRGGMTAGRIVATGGGARSALWLQIKADLFGVPVLTPVSEERACLGAAMLASVAANIHENLSQAAEAMKPQYTEYLPHSRNARVHR
jgi:sugar (pentulose or hexulose) kinase